MKQEHLVDIQEYCNRTGYTWHSDMDLFTYPDGCVAYGMMVVDELGRWIYSERYTEEMAKESEEFSKKRRAKWDAEIQEEKEKKKVKSYKKAKIKGEKERKLKMPTDEEKRAKIKEKWAKKAI